MFYIKFKLNAIWAAWRGGLGETRGDQFCLPDLWNPKSQTGVTDPGMKPGTGNLTVPPATIKRQF